MEAEPDDYGAFLRDRPRCLDGMSATPAGTRSVSEDNGIPVLSDSSTFHIFCRSCESSQFCFTEHWCGKSVAGIEIECLQCGWTHLIFDALEHGYDGELGHNPHLSGERSKLALLSADGVRATASNLVAIFTFNVEYDELEELAAEKGVRAIDLFDWFQVADDLTSENGSIGSYNSIWDFECA